MVSRNVRFSTYSTVLLGMASSLNWASWQNSISLSVLFLASLGRMSFITWRKSTTHLVSKYDKCCSVHTTQLFLFGMYKKNCYHGCYTTTTYMYIHVGGLEIHVMNWTLDYFVLSNLYFSYNLWYCLLLLFTWIST